MKDLQMTIGVWLNEAGFFFFNRIVNNVGKGKKMPHSKCC